MLPLEIDLGPLVNTSPILWISGVLVSLPLVLMVVIAIASWRGHRARKEHDGDS